MQLCFAVSKKNADQMQANPENATLNAWVMEDIQGYYSYFSG